MMIQVTHLPGCVDSSAVPELIRLALLDDGELAGLALHAHGVLGPAQRHPVVRLRLRGILE